MRIRPITALLPVLCLIGLFGCGGGGGGSRDVTFVSGNVLSATGTLASSSDRRSFFASVSQWFFSEAIAQVPGVTITVVETGHNGTTDDSGFFSFQTGAIGTVNVAFSGNGANATTSVVLPAGGTYTFVDVALNGGRISIDQQQITFRGPITGIDCNQGLLQVLAGEEIPYRVRFTASTRFQSQDGLTIGCTDLSLGRTAAVSATVEKLDNVVANLITILEAGGSPPTPTPEATATPEAPPSPTEAPEPTATPEATASPTP